MTDFRALCAELVDSVELLLEMRPVKAKPLTITEGRLSRARTLLAQPEPEGPSNRIASIAKAVQECALAWEPDARLVGNVRAEDIADLCSALLARRPTPQPPADGEVAELVAALRSRDRWTQLTDAQTDRAAELLQRQHPQPVPVSERPPFSHECDEDGCLWLGVLETDDLLGIPHFSLWSYDESRKRLGGSYTHFLPYNTPLLPAHALPLPTSEEVEA